MPLGGNTSPGSNPSLSSTYAQRDNNIQSYNILGKDKPVTKGETTGNDCGNSQ